MRKYIYKLFILPVFCVALLLGQQPIGAEDAAQKLTTIRVGILQYGTVRWELDVIKRLNLARKYDLDIQITALASTQATLTALQSNTVDVIVGDWIWAARQKQFDRNFAFFPYSSSAASVMVDADSTIKTFADLRGKKIGVAGGSVNKSWIIYKAYARKAFQFDLQREAEIKFAAPPLLNELLIKGELDAVINFWHFSARLEARGMRQLVAMEEVLAELGIHSSIPVIGWLFRQEWAQENSDLLNRFLATSYEARGLLQKSDQQWLQLAPLQKIPSELLRNVLRDQYRKGIPQRFGEQEIQATQQLFLVLKKEAGADLSGSLNQIPDELFWNSTVLPTQ